MCKNENKKCKNNVSEKPLYMTKDKLPDTYVRFAKRIIFSENKICKLNKRNEYLTPMRLRI